MGTISISHLQATMHHRTRPDTNPTHPETCASTRLTEPQVHAASKLPRQQTTSLQQLSITSSIGTETKSTTRSSQFPLQEENPEKFRTMLPCLAGVLTENRSASSMARGALRIGP